MEVRNRPGPLTRRPRLKYLETNLSKKGTKVTIFDENTGGCLLSREKSVQDVNPRVGFCFLVGVILNFDWSIFS